MANGIDASPEARWSEFLRAFHMVDGPAALDALIERYGFSSSGLDQRPRQQVYRVVGGFIGPVGVVLTHRWHDPSQAFAPEADVSKVDLDANGIRVATIEWPED